MHAKTRTVDVLGQRYQLRKLPADVGSFILMRLIGAASSAAAHMNQGNAETQQAPESDKKPSGEDIVRMLVTAGLMNGIAFEEFRFIQNNVLYMVSREEGEAGFLPIMADPGRWAGAKLEEQIGDNHPLLMRLMMEMMVFNFADFFDQGGIDGLSGPSIR